MRFFLILFFLWLSFLASSPVRGQAFVPDSVAWVDSVLQSLTLEQKIAQLLNIRAYSNRDEVYAQSIDSIILKYNIGGLTFFQGGPIRQAHLTNRWQKLACTPLFIAIDAETGVGMRLDSVPPFPDPMTLGAANDDSLTYRIGQAIGRQCRRLGIHINFAPVADVNNNPLNPVINQRSFGEDPVRVARLAEMMTRGIQSQGVIATLKHFPGHGDTDSDSHYTLPVIRKDKETLEQTEFLPFLHNAGIAHAVMTAHLFVPSLDSSQGIPTSLSPPVVQEIGRAHV